jgi:hypothetical protein
MDNAGQVWPRVRQHKPSGMVAPWPIHRSSRNRATRNATGSWSKRRAQHGDPTWGVHGRRRWPGIGVQRWGIGFILWLWWELAPRVPLGYELVEWWWWVLLVDVLGSAALEMASNGAATMRVKLGLRHSNSLKSAARAALFIGLFGPTCAQQDYILCFYLQSKFRLSFVVIQRRIREAHGNREKSPLLCWREGEGQALGRLGHCQATCGTWRKGLAR